MHFEIASIESYIYLYCIVRLIQYYTILPESIFVMCVYGCVRVCVCVCVCVCALVCVCVCANLCREIHYYNRIVYVAMLCRCRWHYLVYSLSSRVHYLEINDPYRTWQESFKVDEVENSTG